MLAVPGAGFALGGGVVLAAYLRAEARTSWAASAAAGAAAALLLYAGLERGLGLALFPGVWFGGGLS